MNYIKEMPYIGETPKINIKRNTSKPLEKIPTLTQKVANKRKPRSQSRSSSFYLSFVWLLFEYVIKLN
jgi:hypothetical protein